LVLQLSEPGPVNSCRMVPSRGGICPTQRGQRSVQCTRSVTFCYSASICIPLTSRLPSYRMHTVLSGSVPLCFGMRSTDITSAKAIRVHTVLKCDITQVICILLIMHHHDLQPLCYPLLIRSVRASRRRRLPIPSQLPEAPPQHHGAYVPESWQLL